jgi:predicted nicotinamide N-methyase
VSRARWQLLQRITRRWAITPDQWQLGPHRTVFYRVTDPNAELDRVVDAIDRAERTTGQRLPTDQLNQLPYWAELWESSIAVARTVAAHPSTPGQRVLDLGCGMGLAGVGALLAGAHVTFADYLTHCLLFARLNALVAADSPSAGTFAVRKIDWNTDSLGPVFDLILGADIVYERASWPALIKFLPAHLAPGGSILIGEPGRPTGTEFLQHVESLGWRTTSTELDLPDRNKRIRLFRLYPPAPAPRQRSSAKT